MIAYNNKAALKKHYVAVALMNEREDRFVQGLYWGEEKEGTNLGCWCDEPGEGYEQVAKAMGVPAEILDFAEGLFEALPQGEFERFPRRLAEAIPVGADLRYVWCGFLHWVMVGGRWGMINFMESPETSAAVRAVAHLYEKASRGEPVGVATLTAATKTSWEAWIKLTKWGSWEEKVTRDAKAARACWAIWDCWVSQPRRAGWAARAAHSGSDEYAVAQAAKLIELLKKAPVAAAKPAKKKKAAYTKSKSKSKVKARSKRR